MTKTSSIVKTALATFAIAGITNKVSADPPRFSNNHPRTFQTDSFGNRVVRPRPVTSTMPTAQYNHFPRQQYMETAPQQLYLVPVVPIRQCPNIGLGAMLHDLFVEMPRAIITGEILRPPCSRPVIIVPTIPAFPVPTTRRSNEIRIHQRQVEHYYQENHIHHSPQQFHYRSNR